MKAKSTSKSSKARSRTTKGWSLKRVVSLTPFDTLKASVKEFVTTAEDIYRGEKTYERWTTLAAEILKLNRSLHETERHDRGEARRENP